MKNFYCLGVVFGLTFWMGIGNAIGQEEGARRWWRGNLHTHSLWSDGDDFPEMIVKWYVDHGEYHFLALTDHNVLSKGDRWMDLAKIEARGGKEAFKKYVEAFGDEWVETRKIVSTQTPNPKATPSEEPEEITITKVRLKPLDEFRGKFEVPGKFLMIEGEEISDRAEGGPVHMNAINLQSVIGPVGGKTVRDAMNNNLRAAAEQAQSNGKPILVQLNHPNFGWAVTAEDLAAVTAEKYFEVYNGHPGVNHLGNDVYPGVEKIWDITNTIRVGRLKAHPMYGTATDDSHYYHGRPGSHPGRGWIMVRSKQLEAKALIEAMERGEFYASSGVELESIEYDPEEKRFAIKIKSEPGVQYKTQFIGTRKGYQKESNDRFIVDGKPVRATRIYSEEVGAVLKETESLEPTYSLKGDELFVRAVVTSTADHPDPSFSDQTKQAWTQPVGWELHVKP